jgi:hypothetical protein
MHTAKRGLLAMTEREASSWQPPPQERIIFLSILAFLINIWEINPAKTFLSNLALLSCVSPIGVTYKGVTPYALTRLGSTVSHTLPCGWSHAARVTLSDMVWLNHASSFSMTGPPRVPRPSLFLPPLFLSFFLFPFFTLRWLHWWFVTSLSYSKPVVPQIKFVSWYPNCVGHVRHLYCLILLYFENYVWMNSCGRDLRINQCNCD